MHSDVSIDCVGMLFLVWLVLVDHLVSKHNFYSNLNLGAIGPPSNIVRYRCKCDISYGIRWMWSGIFLM